MKIIKSEARNMPESHIRKLIRLRPGVIYNRREAGNTILIPPDGEAPIRISQRGEELLPLLVRGADIDQLEKHLLDRNPGIEDSLSKLMRFLTQLERNGLLESDYSQYKNLGTRAFRVRFRNPDPLAREIAKWIEKVPGWLKWFSFAGMFLLGFYGLSQVLLGKGETVFLDVFDRFDLPGFVVFLLVVVPLHEFAHAVACRLANVPVSGAGFVFHNLIIPGPYVDTTQAYRVISRWKRLRIPAAGLFIDYMAGGLAAWVVIWSGQEGRFFQPAYFVMCICVLFLFLDLNPFNPSDGSHMIETLLDDELLREVALFRRRSVISKSSAILIYRGICAFYIGFVVLVVGRIAEVIP